MLKWGRLSDVSCQQGGHGVDMDMDLWNDENVRKLIQLVRSNPGLFAKGVKMYKDQAAKQLAWETIGANLLQQCSEAVALSQNAEEDLDVVHKGTPMWKVRSFSKWFRRRYYVDSEDAKLKYEPSHKNNCITEPRYIQVGEIVDVRRGWKTDTFNKFGNKVVGAQRKLKLKANKANEDEEDDPALCTVRPLVDEACCFSVVYGDNRCSLDLVASSPQMAATWVRALRHVVTVMRGLNQEKRFIMWLQSQFNEADRDKSGSLHFDECLRLLLQLNVKMSKSEALRIFNLADTNKVESPTDEPSLDAKEFVQFYQLIMRRPEVEEIYHRYARSAREMTAMELQHFLRKEQGMTEASLDDCHSLVDAFEQSELKAAGRISIHGFTHLLRSEQFQIMKTVHHKTVYHDMTQPLSSYYIATSHNTYLLGRQVVAESTMEGYVEALRRGCRCLELDCWDGPEGEPVVTHGYALTSKIVFREVLEDAILPSAFAFSEYPLILSLENHCTSEQQKRLAFHITDVFGDLVYLDSPSEDMETLPSPEQLKRRIIIKGRKAKPVQTADSESEDDDEMDSLSPPNSRLNGNGSSKGYESTSDSEGSTSAYSQRASPTRPRSPAASHQAVEHKSSSGLRKTYPTPTPQQLEKVTDQDLSDLVNICQGVHFHGFDDPDSKCYEMVSLSESKATKLLEKNGEDFIRFNSRRLSRIYPSGTRTGSTNFQPCHFWNSGCQLVALNYQGQRGPVLLNDAKFRDNGACGFILKPDFLRLPDFAKYSYLPTANSVSQLQGLRDRRHLLEIKIISGQHLPKTEGDALSSIVDPYVKVKIVGHPVDTRKKQTHVVSDNGLNPRWDCSFQFVVNLPELAFVIFIVKDETPGRHDPIVGLYALPFHSISPGYRHVPLLDSKHRPMEPASLFIHTKITEVSY